MELEGLTFDDSDARNLKQLIKLVEDLPEDTIQGLSEYDPSRVYFKDDAVVINPVGNADPLTVNFPEGSTNNVAKKGSAYFNYKGTDYEVILYSRLFQKLRPYS